MRIKQKVGTRGSLTFIQRLLSPRPELFDTELQRQGIIAPDTRVKWVSPLEIDDWAEYRDAAFLKKLGRADLVTELGDFWPERGPQWDALGVAGNKFILVEAKAHVGEFTSSCSAKAVSSRKKIAAALDATKVALGVCADSDWLNGYYQLANRFAHLNVLRMRGADETGMPKESTSEAYGEVLSGTYGHLGLAEHSDKRGIALLYVDVAELT